MISCCMIVTGLQKPENDEANKEDELNVIYRPSRKRQR